jgi:predicted HicB family RNase H-like nuclease
MNTMTYIGYAARIEYSDEDACFIGHIAGIKDVIGFHAESVRELPTVLEEAVDDYLATCEKLGRAQQEPYSGQQFPLPRAKSVHPLARG